MNQFSNVIVVPSSRRCVGGWPWDITQNLVVRRFHNAQLSRAASKFTFQWRCPKQRGEQNTSQHPYIDFGVIQPRIWVVVVVLMVVVIVATATATARTVMIVHTQFARPQFWRSIRNGGMLTGLFGNFQYILTCRQSSLERSSTPKIHQDG